MKSTTSHIGKRILTGLAGFWAVVMLLQATAMGWLGGYFLWNQNQIVESFCEQRKAPVNHCQGSCYLARQMKHVDSGPAEAPAPERPSDIRLVFLTGIVDLPRKSAVCLHYAHASPSEVRHAVGSTSKGFLRAVFVPPKEG